jgi:hypothetical protein
MNNIAEYKLRVIGVQTYVLHTDLKVVSSQIEKKCITREPTLEKYLALVRRMKNHFKGFTVDNASIATPRGSSSLAMSIL